MRTFAARVGCVAALAIAAAAIPWPPRRRRSGRPAAWRRGACPRRHDRLQRVRPDGGALVSQRARGGGRAATRRGRAEPDAVRRRHRDRRQGAPGADLPAVRDDAAHPAGVTGRRIGCDLLRVLAGRRDRRAPGPQRQRRRPQRRERARSGAGGSPGRASTAPSRTRTRSSTRSCSPPRARSPRHGCPACRPVAVQPERRARRAAVRADPQPPGRGARAARATTSA